jgi:hypothetical protein
VSIKPGRVSSRARVSAARLSRTAVASSWGVRAERALSVTRPVVIDLAIQKYDIHGTMHLHVAIVFNEAQFRNLFMKPLTRELVVPTILATVAWLIFAITGFGLPCLPKFAMMSSSLARRFSLELKS